MPSNQTENIPPCFITLSAIEESGDLTILNKIGCDSVGLHFAADRREARWGPRTGSHMRSPRNRSQNYILRPIPRIVRANLQEPRPNCGRGRRQKTIEVNVSPKTLATPTSAQAGPRPHPIDRGEGAKGEGSWPFGFGILLWDYFVIYAVFELTCRFRLGAGRRTSLWEMECSTRINLLLARPKRRAMGGVWVIF